MLCAPFIAMQFTSEVDWSLGDFFLFALMLLALCAGIEAAMRIPAARRWRIAAICLPIVVFLTVWAELAVGILD